MNSRRMKATPATSAIIAGIMIGFAIEIATGAWLDGAKLSQLGAITFYDIFARHQYWRLLSAMFLHGDGTPSGDALHLAMNLLAIYQIGSLFEVMFGTRRFVIIYFSTGLIASLVSAVVNRGGSSVGASGAIFGILGAFVISVRRSPRWRHERGARSIVKQLVFWIVVNIIVGFQIPQIDMSAHLGGLIAGFILGTLLPHHVPPPPPSQVVVDVTPAREFPAE
jgi:rhomboid protease GluP